MAAILYFKAFHIIGFVAWFSGLFYLVRMFVYHVEAQDKPEPERSIQTQQFHLMEGRVYKIICNPAMMLTWICGVSMLYLYGAEWIKVNTWLHLKLVLLTLLTGYHYYCKTLIVKLEKGETKLSSAHFRMLNEVPALFLFAIVLLAVLRSLANFAYVFLGVVALGLIIFLIIKARNKKK